MPKNREPRAALELWAGVECTVNRIQNSYFDQTELSGHHVREEDLERIASLGVSSVRYPALWEHVSPNHPDERDWSFLDRRVPKLKELGVTPIAGLVHHGSGPSYTSLVDESFPEGLAQHARAVAERFPWLDAYTPVNEPLTTARFSGLYGIWYPHGRDDATFIRCLLNQCKGTALAMLEIRRVNSAARLIQTEDLGKIHATRKLRYQSEFENERRWLSWDLLCGKVDRHHRLWSYLRKFGASEEEILWFKDNGCSPDVLGLNYYVTSERFLDDDVSQYPEHLIGSNGKQSYVDVEAVRVRREGIAGAGAMLTEAWKRYGLPLAITEAHLGCTREEQQRWLLEVWKSATAAKEQGADVRAVTVWSIFGAHNWDCLLAHEGGCYESGVFDLRAPEPRETGLARVVRSLATNQVPDEPALEQPGWWRREIRFQYMPRGTAAPDLARQPSRPILIAGSSGTLSSAFAAQCEMRGLHWKFLGRQEMEVMGPEQVREIMADLQPWAVIHASGSSQNEGTEIEPERWEDDYLESPVNLADVCKDQGCRLISFSSDQVFDGQKKTPYTEEDIPNPLNEVGKSKLLAEQRILSILPQALVIRTSRLFDDRSRQNEMWQLLEELRKGNRIFVSGAEQISPTYAPHLAYATLDLLIDAETGIWHLANKGSTTWFDLVQVCAEHCGLDPRRVIRSEADSVRPSYSVLASAKADVMPTLEQGIAKFAQSLGSLRGRRAYAA